MLSCYKITLVQVTGEPRPTVTWSKDNDDLRVLGVEVYDDESGYHVDIPQVPIFFAFHFGKGLKL